jgi:hypothetical protein
MSVFERITALQGTNGEMSKCGILKNIISDNKDSGNKEIIYRRKGDVYFSYQSSIEGRFRRQESSSD